MKKIIITLMLTFLGAISMAETPTPNEESHHFDIKITRDNKHMMEMMEVSVLNSPGTPTTVMISNKLSYPGKCEVVGGVVTNLSDEAVVGYSLLILSKKESDIVEFTWTFDELLGWAKTKSGRCNVELPQIEHQGGNQKIALAVGAETVIVSSDFKIHIKRNQ